MLRWIQELDQVLRGEKTRLESLREGSIDIRLRQMTPMIIALGVVYGACMGTFALLREDGSVYMQMLASAVKVPALFLLTLLITLPSLYVFNALVGSRLTLTALARLLVAALAVSLAMLSALGPIVAFFSLSTTSYPFMVLLNVLVFAVSGALGLKFLLQTLHRLSVLDDIRSRQEEDEELRAASVASSESEDESQSAPLEISESDIVGPLDHTEGHVLGGHVKTVFQIWVLVFGLVGAQMGWVLRPFIGNPNIDFTWFRERDSNFFEAVWQSFQQLFR